MHKEYILLNGFRKAKKGFTAGFHVPLTSELQKATPNPEPRKMLNDLTANDSLTFIKVATSYCVLPNESLGQSKMSKNISFYAT